MVVLVVSKNAGDTDDVLGVASLLALLVGVFLCVCVLQLRLWLLTLVGLLAVSPECRPRMHCCLLVVLLNLSSCVSEILVTPAVLL